MWRVWGSRSAGGGSVVGVLGGLEVVPRPLFRLLLRGGFAVSEDSTLELAGGLGAPELQRCAWT